MIFKKNFEKQLNISLKINTSRLSALQILFEKHAILIITAALLITSIYNFIYYYNNGLGLAYNDARSHLDISRRVVEGLKPGLAQLGSVWLPLPHLLAVFTVWNDFMWHSGLAGALVSMISFVLTGILIYKTLQFLKVPLIGRLTGVFIFASNINILYLQSTAMTELLLIFTMTAGALYLIKWFQDNSTLNLVMSAFWIMLSTLVRYDGWFLLAWAAALVAARLFVTKENENKPLKQKITETEGITVMFLTLAAFGIFLWLLWNLIIFKDPLYFAFGPFSAKAQQDQLEAAGVLQTKYNLGLSLKFYFYALAYNSNAYLLVLGFISALIFFMDKRISPKNRISVSVLMAPFAFNVLALYLGHSVLFIQGLSGETWFNVRYGVMLLPSLAVFIGYAVGKFSELRATLIGSILLVTFFAFTSFDAVTIDDARVGSSQKNVSEVSGWLKENAANKKGFILISAASHDAIIFSSGLPMSRFIHEGTGLYWESALALPDRWARWIIMRTHDDNDSTFKGVKDAAGFEKYDLVNSFPFADIYELKEEYLENLNTNPVFKNQK